MRETDFNALLRGARLDGALDFERLVEQRMPEPQSELAGGQIRYGPSAVRIRATEVRRARHHDVGQHVVVDIAAERDDTRFVECHGWIGLASIERQLES